MTINENPSGLPEQETTSPTAAVLCDGETWAKTGADWESPREIRAWGDLRDLAAERGGATLFDLADLPTGLTEEQKGAIRSIESKFLARGGISTEIRNAFPEAFGDDLVTAKWRPGDPDEKMTDLLRVAEMDGAHTVAKHREVTFSGPVEVRRDTYDDPYLAFGGAGYRHGVWPFHPGWTITATAPKPADPTGGDPVVRASLVAFVDDKQCIFFRAQDGRWSKACDTERGMWDTGQLIDVKRLSAETIAELMGGEQA